MQGMAHLCPLPREEHWLELCNSTLVDSTLWDTGKAATTTQAT
jgi:hypothetical protein